MILEIFLTFVPSVAYEQKRYFCRHLFYLDLIKAGEDQWIAEGIDRCKIRIILEFFSKNTFPSKHPIIKELSINIY